MINSHHAPDITDVTSCMVAKCDSEGRYNTGLQPQERKITEP